MDQPTQDALLEEVRNLRRDISRLHRTVAGGVVMLAFVAFAAVKEFGWAHISSVGAVITATVAVLGWLLYQDSKAVAEVRKNQPPAGAAVAPLPPKS